MTIKLHLIISKVVGKGEASLDNVAEEEFFHSKQLWNENMTEMRNEIMNEKTYMYFVGTDGGECLTFFLLDKINAFLIPLILSDNFIHNPSLPKQ